MEPGECSLFSQSLDCKDSANERDMKLDSISQRVQPVFAALRLQR